MFSFILLLLQILTIVKSQSQLLAPNVRLLHSAIHVDKKLYIFSGFKDSEPNETIESIYNQNLDDRFFYLDLSKTFDTSSLPWTAIPNNKNNLPFTSFSSIISGGVTASYGGENNDTIYFINNEKDKSLPPVLTFNTKDNSWQSGPNYGPIGRNQMKPITDYNGKIYLLTGFKFTTFQGTTHDKGIIIFDTISSNFVVQDAGISRVEYSATLLPNGTIVYMGGVDADGSINADNFRYVNLYNTIDNHWTSELTYGDHIPSGDHGVSSVLALDGYRIIVFGGSNSNNKHLYVLDTTNFNWYEPKVSGKVPTLKRFGHSANVIGKYMVIAFGK
jgi:N-acetylneuraminic acid mutarotase